MDEPDGWVLVPYDESRVARAVLQRAALLAAQQHAGVLLAVPGADPGVLDVLRTQAQAAVGADVPVAVELVAAGDPEGSLRRLVDQQPVLLLAVPLAVPAARSWYRRAVRVALRGTLCPTIAFHLASPLEPGRLPYDTSRTADRPWWRGRLVPAWFTRRSAKDAP